MSEAIDYNKLLTKDEFESRLRNIGETRYHNLHPFHKLLHGGKLKKGQVQAWALNRYYYQCSIPIKDSIVMSRMKDPELRRIWRKRIIDHDGESADTGGIERWYKLTDGLGLDREFVKSTDGILSTTRFSVDAYVNFARRANWQEAAGSSLTELFAPKIHQARLDNWPDLYPWIDERGYRYFRKRLSEARRDVDHGLQITLDYCDTREKQQRAVDLLQFKLDILWTMLDAMWMAYIEGRPPYFMEVEK